VLKDVGDTGPKIGDVTYIVTLPENEEALVPSKRQHFDPGQKD
jgi:hypothetical protein